MKAFSRALMLGMALALCACGVKGKLKSPDQIELEDKKAAARQAKQEERAAQEAADKTNLDATDPAASAKATLTGTPAAPKPDAPKGDGIAPPPVGTPGALDQAPSK